VNEGREEEEQIKEERTGRTDQFQDPRKERGAKERRRKNHLFLPPLNNYS